MTELRDVYENLPEPAGRLAVFPTVYEGHQVLVSVVGDAEGLRYLSKLLAYMADLEIAKQQMPPGERAHVPLFPGRQLIAHSCNVEICRAEAKDTGAVPPYFEERAE